MFRSLDLTGVFANAVLGGVIARHEKLDPIGFATSGGVVRAGGRADPRCVAAGRSTSGAHGLRVPADCFRRRRGQLPDPSSRARLGSGLAGIDALALGTWAAAGAQKTLAVGLGWLPAILLGTITAVGGGAVRDIVLRRVPGILGGNTLYATCAIAASSVLVILSDHGHPTVGLIASTVIGTGLCLLARWRGWILPSADAWAPTRVIRASYRIRVRKRRTHRRHALAKTDPKEEP